MNRLLKIIVWIVVILVLLAVGSGIVLFTMIKPSVLKSQMTTWVHNKTGRELIISGDIERSIFPWVGLRIHDLRLTNAPGFEPQDNFVSIGQVDVKVKLLPLLSRTVEIGKISFDGVQLNLAKNAIGQGNWQDLGRRKASLVGSDSASNTSAPASAASASSRHFEISIAELEIKRANISWRNAQNGDHLLIKNLDLTSTHMGFNQAFPFAVAFTLEGAKPQITGQFSLDSNVIVVPALQQFKFTKLRLNSAILVPNLPKAQLAADKLDFSLKSQLLTAENLVFTLGDLVAKIELKGENLISQPAFQGHIRVTQFNLRDFLSLIRKNFPTRDPSALQRVSLLTDFTINKNLLKLSSLTMQVDDSTAKGNFALENNGPKKLNFNLDVDQINLDRYLPNGSMVGMKSAATAVKSTPATPVTVATAVADPAVVEKNRLKLAAINGTLQVNLLSLSNIRINNVFALINTKDDLIHISPFKAEVFQGTSDGEIAIDVHSDIPKYSVKEALSNVQLSQLFKSDRLTGTANINLNVTALGKNKNVILHSLNGTTQFNIKNGALLGVDIPYELARAVAVLKKQTIPPEPAIRQTEFSEFTGSGVLNQGVLANENLQILSPAFKITGKGTANFVDQQLNYHLLVARPQEEEKFAIPLLITGTFSKPKVTPDLEAISGMLLKQQLQDKIQLLRKWIK